MRELEGKIAIITGGAQGIGAAGAKELAFQGASVTIMDIDEKAVGYELVPLSVGPRPLHERYYFCCSA